MTLLHIDAPAPAETVSTERPRSSAPPRDWQQLSLIAGGVLFALGNLMHPLEHSDAAYRYPTWEAGHLTIFASIPLLILGLPFLHRLLVRRVSPRLATVAVVASVIGLVGLAPGLILEAFVAPTIGDEAMTDLESGGMGVVNGLMGSAYLGGAIALGWAARRGRLSPRWAGPAIVTSSVVLLGCMGATGPGVGVVIILATAAYGLSLAALAARAR